MKQVVTLIFLLFCLFSWSQDASSEDDYIKQNKLENKYLPSKNKGKSLSNYDNTQDVAVVDEYGNETSEGWDENESIKDAQYSEYDIDRSREERYGDNYGEGGKLNQVNPVDVKDIELPDIDLPDIDLPDVNLPNLNINPIGTWEFWRGVIIFVLVIGVVILLVFLLKDYKVSNRRVKPVDVEDEWNPNLVTKSELNIKLDDALAIGDYRTAVRIHFTYILKELVNDKIILWRPEKTNYDYLMEVRQVKGYDNFQECVRIYDVVWYGDYTIEQKDYNRLQPTLLQYYQSLNPSVK